MTAALAGTGRPVRPKLAATLQVQRELWMRDAACRGLDPELFFPEVGQRTTEAVEACSRCPVREQCLEYALAHRERAGVWGGLGELQRRKVIRERGAA